MFKFLISVYIWYSWLDQTSQAAPPSYLGEATLSIVDRCQVRPKHQPNDIHALFAPGHHCVPRSARLQHPRGECGASERPIISMISQIVYTASKVTWLPALVTSLASLSTVAVFSTSLDCRLHNAHLINMSSKVRNMIIMPFWIKM